MKMLNFSDVIMMVKDFFEREVGRKNLTHIDVHGTQLELGIKGMRFVIDLENMEVLRIAYGPEPRVYCDDACLLIQERLRNSLVEKVEAMVIENCTGYEFETTVETSYSGRCMYGATTAAVYTKASLETLIECILESISELNELGVDFKNISIRYDSMVLGYVYY